MAKAVLGNPEIDQRVKGVMRQLRAVRKDPELKNLALPLLKQWAEELGISHAEASTYVTEKVEQTIGAVKGEVKTLKAALQKQGIKTA